MVSKALADAVYHTVHDNGGPTALGHRLGIRPAVLSNKANPQQPKNQITLGEAIRLQRLTGDYRILRAAAQELGFLVVPLENPPSSDVELLTLYAQWQYAEGQIHGAIAHALDAPTPSADEQSAIESRFFAAAGAGLTYIHRMGGVLQ